MLAGVSWHEKSGFVPTTTPAHSGHTLMMIGRGMWCVLKVSLLVVVVVEAWTGTDRLRSNSASSSASPMMMMAPRVHHGFHHHGIPAHTGWSSPPLQPTKKKRRQRGSRPGVLAQLAASQRTAAELLRRLRGASLPHARNLGCVWLYLRGSSTAKKRAAALAQLVDHRLTFNNETYYPVVRSTIPRRQGDVALAIVALAMSTKEHRTRLLTWFIMATALKQATPRSEQQQQQMLDGLSKERPLRVLCLDGGGMKGRNLLVMIRELERIAGKPVSELFDVVCGTSIGGCGALFVSQLGATATESAEKAFRGLQERCFATTSHLRFFQEGQFCSDQRADLVKELVGGDVPLVPEKPRKDGDTPLAFVVAARRTEKGDPEPFLFRTYKSEATGMLPGTSDATLVDAVVATSAAPVYFPPWQLRDEYLSDGGCAFNNPALVAIHELRTIFPRRSIGCLVSLGCGTTETRSIHTTRLDQPVGETEVVVGKRMRRRHRLSSKRIGERRRQREETITHEYAQSLVTSVDGALYERLDPPLPSYISPAEHRDAILDDMETHTRAWLKQPSIAEKFKTIAAHLLL